MKKPFKNIAIIGYGRFGKLLEKMFKPYGNIYIVQKKHKKKLKNSIQISDLKKMDLVIPAVPISGLKKLLIKINSHLKPGSLIMDVCSVKVKPCKWLKKHLGKDVEILGTHPMFGPDSAKNGYENLQLILCPIKISNKNLKNIKTILKDLKLKLITTTPKKHDQEAAKSLSLVHFIGRGLEETKIKKQKISSIGFERLLTVNETVTNDSWQLFIDMAIYNPYTKKVRENFINNLINLNQRINENENLKKS